MAQQAVANYNNFSELAKLIETSRINTGLVQITVKREMDRKMCTYAYPASIAQAELHAQATKFGYRADLKDRVPTVCPCCMFRIDSEPLSICESTTSISAQLSQNYTEFKLPKGVALFFSFLKGTLLYLFLISLISSIFSLIVNLLSHSNTCNNDDKTCAELWVNLFVRADSADSYLIEDILFDVTILVAIIYFFVYRNMQNNLQKFMNEKHMTEDDYTVLISNIPLIDFPKVGQARQGHSEFLYRKHLQEYLQRMIAIWAHNQDKWTVDNNSNQSDFKQLLNKHGGQLKSTQIVKSISLCYNLSRLQMLDATREVLIDQHEQQDEQQNNQLIEIDQNMDRFSTIPKQIDFLNDCSIVLNKQFATDNSLLFNLTNFTGYAFVSFQFQHYKTYFIQEYQRNAKTFLYNGQYLRIINAAQPKDVLWKNFSLSNSEKNERKANAGLILILILILSFIIVFILQLTNEKKSLFQLTDSPLTQYLIIIVQVVFIMIINNVLKLMTIRLTDNERHKTKTNHSQSLIFKLVLAQFINSASLMFIAAGLIFSNWSHLSFFATAFILISSVFEILYQLVLPQSLWRSIYLFFKYTRHNNDRVNTFQIKLNQHFQYPIYQISERYSYYICKVYVACFYCYVAPLSILLTLLTLAIQYWLDKYNLFKRTSLFYTSDFKVASFCLKMIQSSILLFATGYFLVSGAVRNVPSYVALAGFIVAKVYGLFSVLAPAWLERKIIGRNESSNKLAYDDCVSEASFEETYWTQNSATYLVDQSSITGNRKVTNAALLYEFQHPKQS